MEAVSRRSPLSHALGALRLLCALFLIYAGAAPGVAWAQTYSNASTPFVWIDPSSHTRVGYNTGTYRLVGTTPACGTALPVTDDSISNLIPIGFTFNFGNTAYTQLYIQTNGRLQFNNTTCGSGTAALTPSTQTYPYPMPDPAMNGVMKVFGVDLDPTNRVDSPGYPTPCLTAANCYIAFATVGTAPNRKFVVTWKNVPEWVSATNTSGSFDIQVILNEDGSFVYQYGTINHGGNGTAEVGWQLSNSDYQVLTFGAGVEPAANTAVVFYIPQPVARFWFEEPSYTAGTPGEVNDSSGNLASGTALGGVQPVANGKICRAADIPANSSAGVVDAIQTGVSLNNLSLNMQGAGTITLWYKAATAWGNGATPAQLIDASSGSGQWFYLARTSNGTLYFEVKDSLGSTRSAETSTLNFAANTWVHISIAWDYNGKAGSNQDKLRIWVNAGSPTVSSFTSNGTIGTSIGTVYLGDNPTGGVGGKGTVNSANGLLDEVQFYNSVLTDAQITIIYNSTHTCVPIVFDHLELRHTTGTGLTCTPTPITLVACLNATCSNLYSGGVSGTFTATGATTVIFDNTGGGTGTSFTIPPGSSSTTKGVQITTVGTTLLGAGGLNKMTFSNPTCNFGSPTCTLSAADSGLLLSAPNHVAETVSTLSISAVKKSDSSLACVPAFANVSKTVNLKCGYSNPGTGTWAVRVAGAALNAAGNANAACDGTGANVSVSFDATGVATPSLKYADVGQMSLNATYTGSVATGDTGLVMTAPGITFKTAPAAFDFTAVTGGTIKAGTAFNATVTALNANPTRTPTPNFGKETPAQSPTLTFTRYQPTGAGASNGVFSGSLGAFSGGSASSTNLTWSEVGKIDLAATLVNYLSTGIAASGNTGNTGSVVGRHTPHHFSFVRTIPTPVISAPAACGSFAYSGQNIPIYLSALNLAGTLTTNFDGTASTTPNHAHQVNLSEAVASGAGSLSPTSVPATAFVGGQAGVASALNTSYIFTTKLTPNFTMNLRATDAVDTTVTSQGFVEQAVPLRSGRLRLSSAFGSSGTTMTLNYWAEYWTGQAWVLSSGDTCSGLAAGNVAISNPVNYMGNTVAASTSVSSVTWNNNGAGTIVLAAPTPANQGASFDLALNLGGTTADQSCNPSHPASTGAAKPWLRSTNGSCAATPDRDPASRATFGMSSKEVNRTIHKREMY